mmetsp:Transcript_16467/g.27885  ORF Transcript_16467/g.27885 Transcript_16467/m.27885 type:complete len:207 (-) Transcript_16467:187-807(-)
MSLLTFGTRSCLASRILSTPRPRHRHDPGRREPGSQHRLDRRAHPFRRTQRVMTSPGRHTTRRTSTPCPPTTSGATSGTGATGASPGRTRRTTGSWRATFSWWSGVPGNNCSSSRRRSGAWPRKAIPGARRPRRPRMRPRGTLAAGTTMAPAATAATAAAVPMSGATPGAASEDQAGETAQCSIPSSHAGAMGHGHPRIHPGLNAD